MINCRHIVKKFFIHIMYVGILVTTLHAEDAPINPSGLILEAQSPTSVIISWTDNSTDETGFKIFRDGVLIETTSANVTSYVDNDLFSGTSYTYTVKATNDVLSPFFAIQNLMQQSSDGLEDVTYICVGDSTRAGSLSPFDDPASPYDGGHVFEALLEALSGYGVDAHLYAKHGQEAKQFNLATRSPTWQDVVNIIPNDGSRTLVDISLGINDLWSEENDYEATVEDIKTDLREAIDKIKAQKPNTLIMLTMPNRKYLPEDIPNSNIQSAILSQTYLELSNEMNIPLVDVMGEIMPNHNVLEESWYRDDNIHYHLTPLGQQLISDLILSKILF